MTYCGEHSLVNDTPDLKTVVSLRCRSWLCPHCADDRKRGLIANAFGGAPNTFLTLTCVRREGDDPEVKARQLTRAWRIVRKRALLEAGRNTTKRYEPYGARPKCDRKANAWGFGRRRVQLFKGKLPFLAVIEKTELGWPHLHILLRAKWIDQAWLSAQMEELLDSPNVWIERLTTKSKKASYCVKYCGKAAHKFETTKRYWQSQDYDTYRKRRVEEQTREPTVWSKRNSRIEWITSHWIRPGWRVTYEGPYRAVAERLEKAESK